MNINDELPLAELSIRNLYMPDVDCVYEIQFINEIMLGNEMK